MELLELKDKVLEIFSTDIAHLGDAIMSAITDERTDLYDGFCDVVENDLSVDWMQKIYQYYHADRTEKKQDYTPKSLADFMCRLVGKADVVVDMCAGSGALTIQRWQQFPEQRVSCIEIDKNVIPYLLFNLVIRNIDASVCRADVLSGETYEQFKVEKGEKYGRVSYVKSAI